MHRSSVWSSNNFLIGISVPTTYKKKTIQKTFRLCHGKKQAKSIVTIHISLSARELDRYGLATLNWPRFFPCPISETNGLVTHSKISQFSVDTSTYFYASQIYRKQESPPVWTQEAYRPPHSKCSLCWWGGTPSSHGGVPPPTIRPGMGYPPLTIRPEMGYPPNSLTDTHLWKHNLPSYVCTRAVTKLDSEESRSVQCGQPLVRIGAGTFETTVGPTNRRVLLKCPPVTTSIFLQSLWNLDHVNLLFVNRHLAILNYVNTLQLLPRCKVWTFTLRPSKMTASYRPHPKDDGR